MEQEILPPQSTELSLTPASQILYTALSEEQTDLTKNGIAMLKQTYLPLTIANYEDRSGYEIVRKARIDIKTRLVKLEKARKKAKSITHKYCEHIDEKAEYIEKELATIREHLETQEKQWEKEDENRRELERQRIAARVARLYATGPVTFDGTLVYRLSFTLDGVEEKIFMSAKEMKNGSDEWFELTLKDFERIGGMIKAEAQRQENIKIAKQEEERKKIEEARLALAKEREALARREQEVQQREAAVATPTPISVPTPPKPKEPVTEQTIINNDKERLKLFASNLSKLSLPDVEHAASKQINSFIQQSLKELSHTITLRIEKL